MNELMTIDDILQPVHECTFLRIRCAVNDVTVIILYICPFYWFFRYFLNGVLWQPYQKSSPRGFGWVYIRGGRTTPDAESHKKASFCWKVALCKDRGNFNFICLVWLLISFIYSALEFVNHNTFVIGASGFCTTDVTAAPSSLVRCSSTRIARFF